MISLLIFFNFQGFQGPWLVEGDFHQAELADFWFLVVGARWPFLPSSPLASAPQGAPCAPEGFKAARDFPICRSLPDSKGKVRVLL